MFFKYVSNIFLSLLLMINKSITNALNKFLLFYKLLNPEFKSSGEKYTESKTPDL